MPQSGHLLPRGHLGNGRRDRVGHLGLLGCAYSRGNLKSQTIILDETNAIDRNVLHQVALNQKVRGDKKKRPDKDVSEF